MTLEVILSGVKLFDANLRRGDFALTYPYLGESPSISSEAFVCSGVVNKRSSCHEIETPRSEMHGFSDNLVDTSKNIHLPAPATDQSSVRNLGFPSPGSPIHTPAIFDYGFSNLLADVIQIIYQIR